MDYKKMKTKELLHLISNQIDNQEVNENNKLVIQDSLKELFNKKCNCVKCYYVKIKKMDQSCNCCGDELICKECDCEHNLTSYRRERIVEVCDKPKFPAGINEIQVKQVKEKGYLDIDTYFASFVVYKVEDV